MKKISVIIPYKSISLVEDLKNSVLSLLKQTHKPFEIIIVGPQNSLDFLGSLKKLRLLKLLPFEGEKNEARNIGILKSKGDFILYFDHDMLASRKLLEDCSKMLNRHEAIIIPEKGVKGSFWQECKRLEKKLITYDIHTVTPRCYKKSIFRADEKPFDSSFGLLDEWGFNNNLVQKKVSIGYCHEYVLVKENDFNILKEIKNKFNRGRYMKYFYKVNKSEAWRRINPIKRGLIFYGSKLKYLFVDPTHFIGLLFLKTVDLFAFYLGYFFSFFSIEEEKKNDKQIILKHYDSVSGRYIKDMYKGRNWNKYVDLVEKETVSKLLNLHNLTKGENILDLAMGPGRWSKFFLGFKFRKVFGLDFSKYMVKEAKKHLKDKRFIGLVGKMENLPFQNNYFNKILCFRSLKYSNKPITCLNEMERVIKKGGLILVEVSNNNIMNYCLKKFYNFYSILDRKLNINSRALYFTKTNFYSLLSFKKILKETQNLKIKEIYPLFVLPSIKPPKLVDRYCYEHLVSLDSFLMKLLPKNLFVRSWIFLLQKND